MTTLTFYGGVGEIGGNKVLLEDGGTRLFLDFGTPFKQRYEYFEEYLKPRSGAGLLDILEMGLLPRLKGIYREDLDPEGRYTSRYQCRELALDGVLVSHAHVDHTGYISFLRPEVPIYATAMTAFIAKAVQDSAQSDFEKEVCYLNPRRDSGEGYLSTRGTSYQARPFVLLPDMPTGDAARQFWASSPARTKKLDAPLAAARPETAGGLALKHFPVDHSIFGATAYAIETSRGWVVYTGDIRKHGMGRRKTERFLQEAAKLRPLALIIEGTRAEAGSHSSATEEEVASNVTKELKAAGGLVVADFGPRNVERLITFLDAARASKRRLVILSKDAYLLDAMHLADPAMPCPMETPDLLIYQDLKDNPRPWEKDVLDRYASRLVNAAEVGRHPGDYVLSFSFWDIKNLIDIQPQSGTYIYSSSEAYNEEQEMDARRLHNWLDHFNMRHVGLPEEDASGRWTPPPDQQGFHASGHASWPDIVDMIKEIGPKTVIPVHTENPSQFQEALRGTEIEVRVPELGKALEL